MGEFKPMVKMQTTEPSVVLKLKKGGTVKKADGGAVLPPQASPRAATALANPAIMRQAAMARRRPMVAPVGRGPVAPAVMPPAMKKGGSLFKGKETYSEELAEAKAIKSGKISPAQYAKGEGKEKAMKKATGGVVLGQGGYKKGGAPKKQYAAGGEVSSGRAVAMPKRPVSKPVAVDRLSGVFKKGGGVKKFADGGSSTEDLSKGAYDRTYKDMTSENEANRNAILDLPKRMYQGVKGLFSTAKPAGSVTKTEKSITVAPGKKSGGRVK